MNNRAELMTMIRDFDIEKNERNKKAAAAIAKKQEELNADADQRARDKREEAYALAEKLATEVTASSELVTLKMRVHGQGAERATETKRQTEIRQETEHALAVRNTKLLKRIKDLVSKHLPESCLCSTSFMPWASTNHAASLSSCLSVLLAGWARR